jgi:hypothetical protein
MKNIMILSIIIILISLISKSFAVGTNDFLFFDYPSEQNIGLDIQNFHYNIKETNDGIYEHTYIYKNNSKIFTNLKLILGKDGTIERMIYYFPKNNKNIIFDYFNKKYKTKKIKNTIFLIKTYDIMFSFDKEKYYAYLFDDNVEIGLYVLYNSEDINNTK